MSNMCGVVRKRRCCPICWTDQGYRELGFLRDDSQRFRQICVIRDDRNMIKLAHERISHHVDTQIDIRAFLFCFYDAGIFWIWAESALTPGPQIHGLVEKHPLILGLETTEMNFHVGKT